MNDPTGDVRQAFCAIAAALPTTPCPPWCTRPAGHPWEIPDTFEVSRNHSRAFGVCEVCAAELMSLQDSSTETEDPTVDADRFGLECLGADDAERLGRDLLASAKALRAITHR